MVYLLSPFSAMFMRQLPTRAKTQGRRSPAKKLGHEDLDKLRVLPAEINQSQSSYGMELIIGMN
jgi:hypothetical protein